jgi:putative peptide zinc metalloprotease protein
MATLRPTFSESWYRVADLKIKLRSSAQISRQHYRGDRWYVVRDPAGNQFHRLSAPAYRFVGLLDGHRTVSEAWELVGGQLADDAPTQNEVIQILSQLHAANLVEANVTPDAQVLLKRHKRFQQQRWQNRLMNVLFPRIPLWDPNRFLITWMPIMRLLLSRFGTILWLAVVGTAIATLTPYWNSNGLSLKKEFTEVMNIAQHPGNVVWAFVTFWIIKFIHELGHGFTCRRFGGEVHELGIMFLVLIPAPYVDASTAWGFPNKWHRVLVGAGGMIFELFVAAILAFVWVMTAESHPIHTFACYGMFIASVTTVIFNANPLLRYDGYYILSDWLEIPNLSYRAREYAMGLIKRHLFSVKLPQPLPPLGQRGWLLLYAITSGIYRIFVGVMIIMMVWGRVPVLGVLMALGGVVTWCVVPVVKVTNYLLLDPELHRKRTRAIGWSAAFATLLVIAIGVIKFPFHYYAFGVMEPADKQMVIAQASGTVKQVLAHDGDWVKEGQPILVCSNEQTEKELEMLQSQWRALDLKRQVAMASKEPDAQGQAQSFGDQAKTVKDEIAKRTREYEKLTLLAPRTGKLVLPELKHLPGRFVHEGEELGMIAPKGDLRVLVFLPQDDAALAYLHKGTQAEIRPAGRLGEVLKTQLEGRNPTPADRVPVNVTELASGPVAPDMADSRAGSDPRMVKAQQPQVELWLRLPNADGGWVSGQTAEVRFDLEKKPLIWNWSRRLYQLIQSHSNTKWM